MRLALSGVILRNGIIIFLGGHESVNVVVGLSHGDLLLRLGWLARATEDAYARLVNMSPLGL